LIPFNEIIKLAEALPKCSIKATKQGNYCWILDQDGERIGSIHFDTAEIVIFESYEYSEQVREALGKEKFEDVRTEFEDIGKQLYG